MSVLKHELLEQYIGRDSRRKFLSMVSQVAGAGSLAMVAGAQTTTTTTNTPANDINVLNYALTLEFLEATFYTQFLGQGALPTGVTSFTGLTGTVTGNPTAYTAANLAGATAFTGYPAAFSAGLFTLLTQIRDHEITHVNALIATIKSLGGTPTQPCTYVFPVASINDFLTTAQALENTGVAAYDGAINMIYNPALVQTGATIATVEARHASFLNLIAGGGLTSGNFAPPTTTPAVPGVSASPFPNAFDTPLTMSQVLAIATPFLGSCPVALGSAAIVASATPAASTSAPFSASAITLNLANSTSGNGSPVAMYAFAVPATSSAYCPTGTTSGSSSTTGTTTTTLTSATATCPLIPAILQSPNSATAIIQFNSGPGYYPVQVTITDSAGKTTSQILVLAYLPTGSTAIPSTTPGISMMNVTATTTTGK